MKTCDDVERKRYIKNENVNIKTLSYSEINIFFRSPLLSYGVNVCDC